MEKNALLIDSPIMREEGRSQLKFCLLYGQKSLKKVIFSGYPNSSDCVGLIPA